MHRDRTELISCDPGHEHREGPKRQAPRFPDSIGQLAGVSLPLNMILASRLVNLI